MYTLIKNQRLRLAYSLVTAALCLSGVIEAYDGTAGIFMYFTYLSNILVFLVLVCQSVFIVINLIKKRPPEETLEIPGFVKGGTVVCISFVFLTVFLVLSPFEWPSDWLDARVHYLTPFLTVLEFILFERHGKLMFYYPVCWMFAPIIYYGYVLVLYYNRIRFNTSLFPYFFMDHIAYGWAYVLKMLLMLAGVFLVYGMLLTALDRLPGMIAGRKKKNS